MKISIIIPTYNRAKMLGITIESFVCQNYPKDQYEIIIADNNSKDNTKEVIEEWQMKLPATIKYIFENKQGVHYARNTAAKYAKGEILYYTDDDMIADQNLLSEILKPFLLDDKVATVTGRVLPKWEVSPPQWILKYCNNDLLSLNDPKEDLIIAPYDCNVFSCHQAIKRDVLFEAGGFNPENTAGEWIGDGETGLNIKIKDLGYKFAYNGKSVIYHMISPTRMTQGYLNKRLANQGNCDSYTEYKKYRYSKAQLIRKIISHGRNFSVQALKGALKFVIHKPSWRLNWAKSFYYFNRIKYDYRLIKDEKWRQLVIKYDWINDDM
jgi:glycosyltransferase involved in cell wall biosynthesis